MDYDLLRAIHILSMVLWIGGMMFVQWFLRPALLHLAAPARVMLLQEVLLRFFRAVIVASLAMLISGAWMLSNMLLRFRRADLPFEMPISWWVMTIAGTFMVGVFFHIRLNLFVSLRAALQFNDPERTASALSKIRIWVSINLVLGLLIIVTMYVF